MINYLSSIFGVSSLVTWTAIVVIGITLLLRYIKSKQTYWAKQGVITADGFMFSRFFTELYTVEQQLARKYGKIFGVYEFINPVLYCSDPDTLRDILSKDFHMFTNRRSIETGFDPIIDSMISTVEGDNWKRIRSIMSPTFSTGKLRRMKPLIDECLQILVNNFDKIIKSGQSEYDMKKIFGAFSMEVVIQVAFGTKVDSLFDDSNPIIMHARKIFNRNINPTLILFFLAPKLIKFLKLSIFDRSITTFFKDLTIQIIEERKKQKDTVKRYDFLQLMLDAIESNDSETIKEDNDKDLNGHAPIDESNNEKFTTHNKKLSIDEIVAQSFIFFLAGYETTATTLSYATYSLAVNPDAQQKLYEEAKGMFENNRDIDYDEVHKLKYLDAVISETLRLYPPAIFTERRASEEYTLRDKNIKIQKDMIIHVPIYAMHHDPDNFPDPDEFKPERFFPENRTHHPYSYIPFGAGPRNCIGMRLALMEAKLALIHSVYRYKFTCSPKTKHPPESFKGQSIMVPKEIILKVEKR